MLHLCANFIVNLTYSFVLESHYGFKKFVILYFASGIFGNILSCLLLSEYISIGASSALCGVLILELTYLI